MSQMCSKCNGLIAELGKPYGYSGKFCHCAIPNPRGKLDATFRFSETKETTMSPDSLWKIVWRYNFAEHETFVEAQNVNQAFEKFNRQEKMPDDLFVIEICLCEVVR